MVTIQKITDNDEESALMAERIDELESLMQEAESLRRKQFLVSSCTLLLMLIVLTLFIIGMAAYFKNYPKRTLMLEVIRNTTGVWNDPCQLLTRNRGFDRKVVLLYADELRKAMPQNIPFMRKEIRAEIRSIHEYIQNELKQKFQNHLYTRLMAETREYMAAKKQKNDPRTELLLQRMNAELAAEITAKLFLELEPTTDQLNQFRDEVEFLRNSDVYRKFSEEPREIMENRLMENLLEGAVYLLNEDKGMIPADQERKHE